ncbi:MAG: hypothetical protein A2X94_10725 [Bdellovibrionales bacterium GWB1_55_8]|nr:MAG: hypothetical protein A2X94_10725 [Bdellovibrionales bacterium GWB1_55_8]
MKTVSILLGVMGILSALPAFAAPNPVMMDGFTCTMIGAKNSYRLFLDVSELRQSGQPQRTKGAILYSDTREVMLVSDVDVTVNDRGQMNVIRADFEVPGALLVLTANPKTGKGTIDAMGDKKALRCKSAIR